VASCVVIAIQFMSFPLLLPYTMPDVSLSIPPNTHSVVLSRKALISMSSFRNFIFTYMAGVGLSSERLEVLRDAAVILRHVLPCRTLVQRSEWNLRPHPICRALGEEGSSIC
jgi:hypothetical protein